MTMVQATKARIKISYCVKYHNTKKEVIAVPCISYFTHENGIWKQKDSVSENGFVDTSIWRTKKLEFPQSSIVRINEISESGSVLLHVVNPPLAYKSDPVIYVRVVFANDSYTYVSGTVRKEISFSNVMMLELGLGFVVGLPSHEEVNYTILVNAACNYNISE
jgi:hypothetical protein